MCGWMRNFHLFTCYQISKMLRILTRKASSLLLSTKYKHKSYIEFAFCKSVHCRNLLGLDEPNQVYFDCAWDLFVGAMQASPDRSET